MNEISGFIRKISIENNRRRVKEIQYTGYVDKDGKLHLTSMIGKYYSKNCEGDEFQRNNQPSSEDIA